MRARADAFPQPAFNKSRETCGGTRDAPSRSAAGGQQTGPSHAMQHPLPCPVLGPEADISPSLVRKAQLLTAFTDGHGGRHSGQKRVRWRAREARPAGPSRKLRSDCGKSLYGPSAFWALNRTKVWQSFSLGLPLIVAVAAWHRSSSGLAQFSKKLFLGEEPSSGMSSVGAPGRNSMLRSAGESSHAS